jgi:1,4-dihydroxy-2-naphthoyl-CoA hydrolase
MYTKKTYLKFYFTDAAGILFFANIFLIAHDVYEDILRELGFSIREIIEKRDFLLPLVHSEADYKLPLKAGDKLTINAYISRLGETSFTIAYQFLNGENAIAASAQTVHVAIDKKSGKKRPMPDELKKGLGKFSGSFD